MKRVLFRLFVMGCLLPVYALADDKDKKPGELTDPVEILKKADEASKSLKSVKYKGSMIPEGRSAGQFPTAEGTVAAMKPEKPGSRKFRVEVTGKMPNSAETRKLLLGSDGETYYLVDQDDKKVYSDIDPQVMGSGQRFAGAVAMQEYMHPTPFSDEINGTEHKLVGIEKVGDQDCYKIELKYANVNQRATWFFAKKDFLPRRVQRSFIGPDGAAAGSTIQTVTELQADPKLPDEAFKLTVPEGFTKSEDFAP